MLELAADLLPLLHGGARVGVVSVTDVLRSAPRGPGASLAVTVDAQVIGSISGGCVEADAVALGLQALSTGRAETARLGFSDQTAHAAGLACGGSVDVIAYPVAANAEVVAALEEAAAGRPIAIDVHRRTGAVRPHLALEGPEGEWAVIRHRPPPQLIIAGASEHAAALCRVAAAAGFQVTVVDPWELLVTPARFPDAHRLVIDTPAAYLRQRKDIDDQTAVCVLTHDERLDVPTLAVALQSPAGFVGALGARPTAARRAELLRERGLDNELDRLHSPLGLDLGGASAAETAVSVLAEIIASRHGGTGFALRDTAGPLHTRTPLERSAAQPALC